MVLMEGLILTLLGMSVVFLFLVILVTVMTILGRVTVKYFPDPEEEETPRVSGNRSAEIAVAIAAAKIYAS